MNTNPESVFCLGFLIGAVFASSGLLGFSTGCLLGAMITKYYISLRQSDVETNLVPEQTSQFATIYSYLKSSLLKR